MLIASIDPGKWALPLCVWQDNVLTHACLSVLKPYPRPSTASLAFAHEEQLRAHWLGFGSAQQVYVEQLSLNTGRDGTRGKAISTGNALLEITSIASMVAGRAGKFTQLVPVRSWLGSAPPKVTEARVRATLSAGELLILDNAIDRLPRRGKKESSLAHNIYDACGIGLYATGRYMVRRG